MREPVSRTRVYRRSENAMRLRLPPAWTLTLILAAVAVGLLVVLVTEFGGWSPWSLTSAGIDNVLQH
jgi:hypothetical protein